MTTSPTKTYYPHLDLLKFICCIGIVCQHTKPFEYIPILARWIERLQPSFVATFFVISSSLLWQKIHWDKGDWSVLRRYVMRLLILILVWGVLLLPHWLSKFIHHNPDDWYYLIWVKILLTGMPQGAWFCMSLIYGVLIVYVLNRYLNHQLVFGLFVLVWGYYSMVHYEAMTDYLHIYVPNAIDRFHFESYFSAIRASIWVEAGYYLVPRVRRALHGRQIAAYSMVCLIILTFSFRYHFIAFSLLSILVSSLCMKRTIPVPDTRFLRLREMSIIIFFIHFLPVTLFHYLSDVGYIAHEYGMMEFVVTLAVCIPVSFGIIRLADKYSWPKWLL